MGIGEAARAQHWMEVGVRPQAAGWAQPPVSSILLVLVGTGPCLIVGTGQPSVPSDAATQTCLPGEQPSTIIIIMTTIISILLW